MEFSDRPALLMAPDKFRGTATAAEVAGVVASVASRLGWRATGLPLSDGGEGLLEAFGGANRTTVVTGPMERPVEARWRLDGTVAVIESAEASGLLLAGGAQGNDAERATSRGTGELVVAALEAGAREILVGLGGSACSDGGRGALAALAAHAGPDPLLGGATVTVCADVETRYLDAARVYGPQKGATPDQVGRLADRLAATRADLVRRFGRDPQEVPGSGAAGGVGGALAVAGARVVSGFDHVADRLGLDDRLARADLVLTGEGRLDASSFDGKVVGGVIRRAQARGRRVAVVVGDRDPAVAAPVPVHALSEEHGRRAALEETLRCLAATTERVLAAYGPVRTG
ncbi:glycerate kinase [Nocardioides sp. TF02-7]|uniref:glycerate kinase n=1 Tax=Nocardioides sp. TF02-7 TaxID=2917724 RepID=UPI001F06123B|nr:glycerate kinase [Nocardioides sp. TF02-7]UMG94084.1 glycerate kinase [Nocardioides sp. TF02-7]